MYLGIKIGVIVILCLSVIKELLEFVFSYKKTKQALPDNVSKVYDDNKYQEWLSYYKDNFKLRVVRFTFMTILDFVTVLGGALLINNILVNMGVTNPLINSTVLFAVILLLQALLKIPFDYYSNFVIEEKYGFNKMTKGLFVKDTIKGILILTTMYTVIVLVLLSLYIKLGIMLLVYGTLFVFSIALVVGILYAKVFSKISNKQTPLEDGSLKDKLTELCTKADFSISEIYVMDGSKRSTKANASCGGIGKTRRIVLYDTIIDQLTEEEIVAVIAHEIGHAKHKHILKGFPITLCNILIMIGLLFFLLETPSISLAFNFPEVNYGFAIIIFFEVFSILSILINLIQNKIYRVFEYQADRYAANIYSKEEIKSSLIKLNKENFGNINPSKLIVALHYGHPTLSDRLTAIDSIE